MRDGSLNAGTRARDDGLPLRIRVGDAHRLDAVELTGYDACIGVDGSHDARFLAGRLDNEAAPRLRKGNQRFLAEHAGRRQRHIFTVAVSGQHVRP